MCLQACKRMNQRAADEQMRPRPSKSVSQFVCQNTICNSLGRLAAVSPSSLLPSLNLIEADLAPHPAVPALPRDKAARVNQIHDLAICIGSVILADIPKILVRMYSSSTVPVPIYRICCIKQSQALPLDPAN
jgi:hypothetical protein